MIPVLAIGLGAALVASTVSANPLADARSSIGTRPARTAAPPAAKPPAGYATWYATGSPRWAAAGPELRHPGWRGSSVVVRGPAGRVRITLGDWCACGKRHGLPTLIDLPPAAFQRVCGPLSLGVCRVTVRQ